MKTTTKVFHWAPRILGLLMTLFIGMFALDSFDPQLTLWQQITGFLIHLVPAYIVLATVVIGWKWDLAGCYIYYTLAILYGIWAQQHLLWILGISGPLFLLGTLFLISSYLKKRERQLT